MAGSLGALVLAGTGMEIKNAAAAEFEHRAENI